MRSGIAGRADAGTQAQQFNATPTPATALHAIHDHGDPRPLRQPGHQLARGSRGLQPGRPRDPGRAGAASALARARQMNAKPTPRRGSPSAPDSLGASPRQQLKTGRHHSRQQYTMAASARKPQARTRQQALHAMRSGIAGRADAGTQAQQFNATPTPATALRAIHDHGNPRPLRQPGLQLASGSRGHCSRDAPALPGARGLPAP